MQESPLWIRAVRGGCVFAGEMSGFLFFLHLSHVEFIYRTILKFIKNLCNENNDLY